MFTLSLSRFLSSFVKFYIDHLKQNKNVFLIRVKIIKVFISILAWFEVINVFHTEPKHIPPNKLYVYFI